MVLKKNLSNRIKKTTDRVKKTRLYVIETGKWAAGNISTLMDLLTIGVRTAAGSLSTRSAAVDIFYAVKNYAYSDYKYLFLDITVIVYDLIKVITIFISENVPKKVFGVTTSSFCFYKTLYNKCKETNIFGYN